MHVLVEKKKILKFHLLNSNPLRIVLFQQPKIKWDDIECFHNNRPGSKQTLPVLNTSLSNILQGYP